MTQTDAAPAAQDAQSGAVKYRLTGEVQGVGFRHHVKQNADNLGIRGWARNECDGSVTVLLHGENADKMYAALLQGPPGASVASLVELCVEENDNAAEGFAIC
ncbi:MAG: acylphosphatase [Gammaproteobacteria bacterium]